MGSRRRRPGGAEMVRLKIGGLDELGKALVKSNIDIF